MVLVQWQQTYDDQGQRCGAMKNDGVSGSRGCIVDQNLGTEGEGYIGFEQKNWQWCRTTGGATRTEQDVAAEDSKKQTSMEQTM